MTNEAVAYELILVTVRTALAIERNLNIFSLTSS